VCIANALQELILTITTKRQAGSLKRKMKNIVTGFYILLEQKQPLSVIKILGHENNTRAIIDVIFGPESFPPLTGR
jgi:hypothetical protein